MLMQVFRYCDATGAVSTLRERKLRLSDPSKFNDPFELFGREPVFDDNKGTSLRVEFPKMFAEQFRILCCSRTLDSILMWSHYADKHAGIVLEIETSEIQTEMSHAVREVKYRTSPPAFPLSEEAVKAENEWLLDILTTKAVQWSYEEEVRLTFKLEELTQDSCLYPALGFDPSCIKRAILGCRFKPTSESDLDFDTILKDPAYQHVVVERAVQHKTDYKLHFESRSD